MHTLLHIRTSSIWKFKADDLLILSIHNLRIAKGFHLNTVVYNKIHPICSTKALASTVAPLSYSRKSSRGDKSICISMYDREGVSLHCLPDKCFHRSEEQSSSVVFQQWSQKAFLTLEKPTKIIIICIKERK